MPARPNLTLVPKSVRHVLNGPTMGTRWSAVFYAPERANLADIAAALQMAVDAVDDQMSPWKPNSMLSRFNKAAPGTWHDLPAESFDVLSEAIALNGETEGLFDPFLGGPVKAWGFGCAGSEPDATAIARERQRAAAGGRAIAFDRDNRRLSRRGDAVLDLCGIAKGYGVDRLSEVLSARGIVRHLVSIDGELRAEGEAENGRGWTIAIEKPDPEVRDVALALEIGDMAVATSGNYRHRRTFGTEIVSHTIDPRTGAPTENGPASVTVLGATTMQADALATALMVMGTDRGLGFATRRGIAALFIEVTDHGVLRMAPSPRFSEVTGISEIGMR